MRTSKAKPDSLAELVQMYGFDLVGLRIRQARNIAGFGIRELAQLAQVSKNTLLRIEHGQPVHISTIRNICRALRTTPRQLFEPERPIEAVLGVQRAKDLVLYDMNTFKNVKLSRPMTDEELSLWPSTDVIPFAHLMNVSDDRLFTPHIMYIAKPTPDRSHKGLEWAYILEGSIRVVMSSESVELELGDSILFHAAEVHRYEPIEPAGAKVLSLVVSPLSDILEIIKPPEGGRARGAARHDPTDSI